MSSLVQPWCQGNVPIASQSIPITPSSLFPQHLPLPAAVPDLLTRAVHVHMDSPSSGACAAGLCLVFR